MLSAETPPKLRGKNPPIGGMAEKLSIIGEHVVKGIAQLVGTLLDLELLPVDLILDVVDLLVQLRDVHLAILKPE